MLIGIVGKANVGKSTFFKAATLAEAEIANYPFATIKPNSAVGFVRIKCVEEEFKVKCNPREGYCLGHERFVPVMLLDVAGLVPDAHKGKGMGNQFLNDLNQADALIHVIDASGGTNEKGEPVQAGSYDPANDVRFLEVELDMWYLGILKKGWEKFTKQAVLEKKEAHKAIAKQLSGLGATESMVDMLIKKLGLDASDASKWSEQQLMQFAGELRKKTKPMLIAANKADTRQGGENIQRLKEIFYEYTIIPCSAESELALKEAAKKGLIRYIPGDSSFEIMEEGKMNDGQLRALSFIRENVLGKFGNTGVQSCINRAVLEILGRIAVFPGGVSKLADQYGNILPDCFLLPPGSTALDFAYAVHTDLGKKFIRAINVRTKMPVGKEHRLEHRDIIEIVADR